MIVIIIIAKLLDPILMLPLIISTIIVSKNESIKRDVAFGIVVGIGFCVAILEEILLHSVQISRTVEQSIIGIFACLIITFIFATISFLAKQSKASKK